MRNSNKKALSIILVIILTIIMSLIAIYLIDYIIPFSKNVKGIENVSKAYYQAEKGVEESLFYVKNNFGSDFTKTFNTSTSIDYKIGINALGSILPPTRQGNSEFSSDYNRIRIGEPIQLEIGKGKFNGNSAKFTFKIPDISSTINSGSTLIGGIGKVINWQLVSTSGILYASGSQILADDITNKHLVGKILFNGTNSNSAGVNFNKGIDRDGSSDTFTHFYSNHCGGGRSCILKMSLLSDLKVDNPSGGDDIPLPYLDRKINLNNGANNIPLRYTQIHTEGKSYGFKKTLDAKVPQQTINEAFDFTVFQ